jgi:hypothetical protein
MGARSPPVNRNRPVRGTLPEHIAAPTGPGLPCRSGFAREWAGRLSQDDFYSADHQGLR